MARWSFDLGWSMGWCEVRRSGELASGVERLAYQQPDDGLRLVAATEFFGVQLKRLEAAGETLEAIDYEEINFVGDDNGIRAMHCHGMQLGALLRWAAFRRQPRPTPRAWNTVKKHVTGHGSASQQLVLERVRRLYPHVTDHNEASAVAVMLTALHLDGLDDRGEGGR